MYYDAGVFYTRLHITRGSSSAVLSGKAVVHFFLIRKIERHVNVTMVNTILQPRSNEIPQLRF